MSAQLLAFNRGRISPLALARVDFKRTPLSAEIQTNWMPRTLGAMSLRPGLGYAGATRSNLASVSIPFIFSRDDTARIELTDQVMRVWIDDALVTRPAVSAVVANGSFNTDVSSWSDQDSGSAASTWLAGGYLKLLGDGTNAAKRRQQVTVTEAGTRHALNIAIARGPVIIRVGSSAGGDQYIAETTLMTGVHSLAFTPTGDFHIDLFNTNETASLVDFIGIAAAGAMELIAPWVAADLAALRWDQSGDVVFVAASGYRQRRIERRASDSWSVVTYQSDNGPFRLSNVSPTTITPSDVLGDITLTASAPLFRSSHVGALFRATQSGQSAVANIAAADTFSDPIRVTGVDGSRVFAVILEGTWTATVTLQYSVAEPGTWVDADAGTWTANTSESYDDTLDNQIIFYRIGIKAGNYTSGTVEATLSYQGGSQTGIARITGFTSSTVVDAAVLTNFGNTNATNDWAESYWSDYRGYPSSVAFHEGRLWWAGKDRVWGSVSDDFSNFDDTVEGDSGPISRSIGSGPVDTIHWLASAQRLLLGADGAIYSLRSSSLDEPITPLNFNLKKISTQGSKNTGAVTIDTSIVFPQRGGRRVFEAAYDAGSYDYAVAELSGVVPEICDPSIIKIAVQHQPEKRIHCIRSDGTVALLCYDKQEEVTCWVDIETEGFIEDAVVLPGETEDRVYYTVRRTINGASVRYHEKFAVEEDCRGFPDAKLADSFIEWSGVASTAVTGLSTLEGEEVTVWGWRTDVPFTNADGDETGKDLGTFTVSGGVIIVGETITNAVVGLAYTARFKSTKLAYVETRAGLEYSPAGLCRKKRVAQIGIIGRWLHAAGLRYGPSFDLMDDLPQTEKYTDVGAHEMRTAYDEELFTFPGDWSTDSRIFLEAASPRPCTLLACIFELDAG